MGKHLNSKQLYLPLFLASRNRIKKFNFYVIRNYITKHLRNYKVSCFEETGDNGDCQKVNQSAIENSLHSKTIKAREQGGRSEMSWHLPPNRYNIPNEIGTTKNGIQWSRSMRKSQLKKNPKLQNQRRFYEISTNYFEKSKNKCHRHKGKFLTDPRKRRPTTRFMISNPVTCCRNPADPGPTRYFLGIFTRTRFPKLTTKHIRPHKFLRYSCVPENVRLRTLGKSSFSPGPGRYELLDDEESLRKELRMQTQKLLKFRRFIHFKQTTSPKTKPHSIRRHIFGYGFTRLFRGPPKSSKKIIPAKKHHKTGREREVRMFPSFENIKMITNPERQPLSMRTEELPEIPITTLRFGCLVRFRKRRQLRDNKKVVFGSGMSRFKDSDTPTVRNQLKPPPLVNLPIMTVNPREIQSKLNALPERLRGIYKTHRLQSFKFQPIPPVKLLLDDKEVRPESDKMEEVYPRELSPMDFFKEEFKKKSN